MVESRWAILLASGGPGLRWKMQELERRYGYRVDYPENVYEAQRHLESHVVHAVVCEAAPAHTTECRFVKELSQRSGRHPVIVYVEPEEEEELLDELAHGTFQTVRASAPLDDFHQTLKEAIEKSHPRSSAAPEE